LKRANPYRQNKAEGLRLIVVMPPGLVAEVDDWGAGHQPSRSETIRVLIRKGLEAFENERKQTV